MRLSNIIVVLFLLVAFSIGSSITDQDRVISDSVIDDANIAISNITLTKNYSEDSFVPNINGFISVLEKYIKFVGSFVLEVFRAGIYFGQDNPEFFDSDFIFQIIKLVVILMILSLLIKPLSYIIIFIVLIGMYLRDKYMRYKKMKLLNEKIKLEEKS